MKFVLLIICLFFVRVLPAQKPVTIECRIGEGIGKIMQLSGVNNGQQKILASASLKLGKMSANSACAYIYHQPKMPDELKK